MSQDHPLKKTALHDRHVALGAKMVPFAGFNMPVMYSGIIDEHNTVRNAAGLFDVSHMGEVWVNGPNAFNFVQNLVSNDVSSLYDGKAQYTVMCREDGGIMDDLLVYRVSQERYLLVINASNIEVDTRWMHSQNQVGAELNDASDVTGLLALQGPASFEVLKAATGFDASDLKYYHFVIPAENQFMGISDGIISRTGYTGEQGVEIYCATKDLTQVWDELMSAGNDFGLKPIGLGARDTLRLESGFCLYGNDISTETNPLEAGLGWITKLSGDPFVGKSSILKMKEEGLSRRLVGFVVEERGIPRSGYDICSEEGMVIGQVTSGTQSPVLGKGIGLGYVENNTAYTAEGSLLGITARGRTFKVRVNKTPFHK